MINEEEAQIIRLIYDMARKGESLSKISLRLKEMDIPSPQGDKERKDSEKRKIYR
ncbi:recombinase family protein [Flintibacter sp. P01028]|uniref:recombinase family protein n=1 Tax=Eubacteriales TaxID=186802 RepID=UPI001DB657FA|nr:recombinase family protein [Clostridiales bacterium]